MSSDASSLSPTPDSAAIEAIVDELAPSANDRRRRILRKFVIAAIGSIPWVGGFMAATAEIPGERAEAHRDDLRTQWLVEHQRKLEQLQLTLNEIRARFEELGPEIEERLQSPGYLALVRQAFRAWDQAETDDKRRFVANLVSNSAGTRICSDDVVRLFISWLSAYHEAHFAVIRELHSNPGSTRFDIWTELYGELPREDSAEADLFRMLIRDLSTGGVIRQERDTTSAGEFVRQRPARRRGAAPSTLKSSFDDQDQYVLTELGKQFVAYTLMGEIRRLGSGNG